MTLAVPAPILQLVKLKIRQGGTKRNWGKLGFTLGSVLDPSHREAVRCSG